MFYTRILFQSSGFTRIAGADVLYIDKGIIALNKRPGLVCQLAENKAKVVSVGELNIPRPKPVGLNSVVDGK
jgi:23S rRNA-/tRNA-specific pseudouridylate synthase